MKRIIICMFVALLATVTIQAQQIAVVTGNTTKMCQTLEDAIKASSNGSVIYLPGGGFQISDDVKITKRVSIIGIGHKAVSVNADGNTVISGNLYFNEGSDGSAVMGCYISGGVYIGYDEKSVNNILIKLCNLNYVSIQSNKCTGTIVDQNYIRATCGFGSAQVEFTHNIAHSIYNIQGGTISNNIFLGMTSSYGSTNQYSIDGCSNSTISNNVICGSRPAYSHMECTSDNNLTKAEWKESEIINADWDDVFENYNNGTISPASNFHFKGNYTEYEKKYGIYAGTGFDKDALPPVPYIVNKNIASQTDASGKLNIQIRVKAGQ